MYNRQSRGIYCMAQETQTWALYQPRGGEMGREMGESFKEGDVCMPMAASC